MADEGKVEEKDNFDVGPLREPQSLRNAMQKLQVGFAEVRERQLSGKG